VICYQWCRTEIYVKPLAPDRDRHFHFLLGLELYRTFAIRPEESRRIYWTMVLIHTLVSVERIWWLKQPAREHGGSDTLAGATLVHDSIPGAPQTKPLSMSGMWGTHNYYWLVKGHRSQFKETIRRRLGEGWRHSPGQPLQISRRRPVKCSITSEQKTVAHDFLTNYP
jgi:hypothetical protein